MKKESGWDRFRLTDAEKEELWSRIAPGARGGANDPARARGWARFLFPLRPVPALIGGAVALTLVALVVGQFAVRGRNAPGGAPYVESKYQSLRPAPDAGHTGGTSSVPSPQTPAGRADATPPRVLRLTDRGSPAPAAPGAPVQGEASQAGAPSGSGGQSGPGEPAESGTPPAVTTTEPVVVESQAYMTNVKSGSSEQKITSERLQKYSIDSVEDARNKEAGIVIGGPQPHLSRDAGGNVQVDDSSAPQALGSAPAAAVPIAPAQDKADRGGVARLYTDRAKVSRESEIQRGRLREYDEERARLRDLERREREDYEREFRARCWIPPRPDFDMMYFKHTGINPFVLTRADALSTFGLDVDNASYTVTRAYLERGQLPPQAAVRVEEFVNFFKQDYPRADEGDFRIVVDGAPSPFHEGYTLLRVGLRARDVRPAARKPASLTLVIDVSGSMGRENRLELVKRAVRVLLDRLDPSDTVGIVTYTTEAQVVLEPVRATHRELIESVLESLRPQETTNLDQGLQFGYRMARQSFRPGAINRIVLCTDGVANEGITNAEGILDHVRREADAGIHLTAIGVGMGNYNDVLLEKLADQGDGNYYYVDSIDEARRVFGERLTGTLQTVAKDAKVQVEFDPDAVSRWRLLGYEKRAIADRDFRNDAVDAGEVGAGHQVTALYEIKFADERRGDGRLGVVRLRYREPESEGRAAGLAREQAEPFTLSDLSRSFRQAPERLRLDAAVAEFAEILRGSYWARGDGMAEVARIADEAADELGHDPDAQEFAKLVHRAAELHGYGDEKYREEIER